MGSEAAAQSAHGACPPPPKKIIRHMHTPSRTSQCWSRQTPHGLGVCIWMHLVNATGNSPSPGQPTPGAVKQDKSSGGSIDTTKTRSGPQRVRLYKGKRPIGAANGKPTNTMASCQPPPPQEEGIGTYVPEGPHLFRVTVSFSCMRSSLNFKSWSLREEAWRRCGPKSAWGGLGEQPLSSPRPLSAPPQKSLQLSQWFLLNAMVSHGLSYVRPTKAAVNFLLYFAKTPIFSGGGGQQCIGREEGPLGRD